MKILTLSDTHTQHRSIPLDWLQPADMIIHAGDFSETRESEVIDFINWFSSLDYKHKIFIPGNHDFFVEAYPQLVLEHMLDKECILLVGNSTTIEGIVIYGSPYTRNLPNWAFHLRDTHAEMYWDTIPDNIDILVTHGPAKGILDIPKFLKSNEDKHIGDKELADRILQIRPKYHIHGHIHEAYGVYHNDYTTTHINCSVLNERYELVNKPILIEI